jgi:phospholipase C
MPAIDRRRFLRTAAAGVGAAAAGGLWRPSFANIALPGASRTTVRPRTPIEHTLVLMMENRSVDHYLGWRGGEAGFDATQHRTYTDDAGIPFATEAWGASGRGDYRGCGFQDPGHGWDAGRVQAMDNDGDGEPDGWLREGSGNDAYALSYYGPNDVPVTAAMTRRFTTFDRYFASVLTSTYPNREYLHSCQGIRNNDFPPETGNPDWTLGFDWPTLWDTLDMKGVTWKYYFSNLPVIALWGRKNLHGARHISEYYLDALLGTLPQVAFIDPWFVGPDGLANDDHPHADNRLGQQLISDVVTALLESPAWHRSALFVTYDEWGGFFDHVAPPSVADPRAAEGFDRLGFRVPTHVVSPYAPAGATNSGLYDHTSIVKFIEGNFGLVRLADLDPNARDAGGRDIGNAFGDFSGFDPEVDVQDFRYTAPPGALTGGCQLLEAAETGLHQLAAVGWFDDLGLPVGRRFEESFRTALAR